LVAVIVTVSPVVPPLPVSVGEVSLVVLSVALAPVSEDEARSGAVDGAAGGLTIVSGKALDADDVLPAGSVSVALTLHDPGANVGRSHDWVPVPIVYVQLTVVEPFVAVIVTTSPTEPPLDSDTAGVASVVLLSVFDVPLSDAAARSGAPGAVGADVSITRFVAGLGDETLPYESVSVAVVLHVPAVNAGRLHELAGST
jgi:hypothetical protein